MIKIENRQVFSDSGKLVHRKGTDAYFKKGMVLKSDSEADFEEVDEIPAYTKAEYDAKVAELVRQRYTESEEFAIQRKAINAAFTPAVANAESAMREYEEYNGFVERCKEEARNADLYKK